jgi:hypothetical protein
MPLLAWFRLRRRDGIAGDVHDEAARLHHGSISRVDADS